MQYLFRGLIAETRDWFLVGRWWGVSGAQALGKTVRWFLHLRRTLYISDLCSNITYYNFLLFVKDKNFAALPRLTTTYFRSQSVKKLVHCKSHEANAGETCDFLLQNK
jgi:hypothetical protein